MFATLFKMGLKPQNVHIIGKCYSTDPIVYDQLKLEGAKISPLSTYFDSHYPYDFMFDKKIKEFFSCKVIFPAQLGCKWHRTDKIQSK